MERYTDKDTGIMSLHEKILEFRYFFAVTLESDALFLKANTKTNEKTATSTEHYKQR